MKREGCKYCMMMEDGDAPADRKYLFRHKLGKVFGVDFEIFDVIYDNELVNGTSLGCEGSEYAVKINYCPMCGRKLEAAK